MASFRETIHLLIDIDGKGANTSIGKLRTELAQTDGAFSKMRVGAIGAFDIIKQHAATAGIAAATAIAAFSVKAVGDFQDVALGAGKLRDALGVTAEEASRLQEVAGDLEIPVSALESTIGRMNRTAAGTPEAFDAIGAAIVRNSDGTINVTETFLSTIDALNKIPDAAKRAEAAQKIFGRSWQDIAELVGLGADGVREAMASVESQNVFNDAQIDKGRQFRDMLDDLKGIGESVSLVVGEQLVDAMGDIEDAFRDVEGPLKAVRDGFNALEDVPFGDQLTAIIKPAGLLRESLEELGTIGDALGITTEDVTASFETNAAAADYLAGQNVDLAGDLDGTTEATEQAYEAMGVGVDALLAGRDASRELSKTLNSETRPALDSVKFGLQLLKGELDFEHALLAFESRFYDAIVKTNEGTALSRDEILGLKDAVLEAAEFANLNPVQVKSLLDAIDAGAVAGVLALVQGQFDANRPVVRPRIQNLTQLQRSQLAAGNLVAEAGGTNDGPAGAILVGEEGPEIVQLPAHHRTIPADETARILSNSGGGGGTALVGGGGGNVINVYMPPGTDGRDLTRQLERYKKYNGPGR